MLDIYHVCPEEIEGGIISSVVPQITTNIKLAAEKILKKEILVIGSGIKTGLDIRIDDPASWAPTWWRLLWPELQNIQFR